MQRAMNSLAVSSGQSLVDVAISFGHLEALESLLANNDIGYSEVATGQQLKYEPSEVVPTRQKAAKVQQEVVPEYAFTRRFAGQSLVDLAVQRGSLESLSELLELNEVNLLGKPQVSSIKGYPFSNPIGLFVRDKGMVINTGIEQAGEGTEPPAQAITLHYKSEHYKNEHYK